MCTRDGESLEMIDGETKAGETWNILRSNYRPFEFLPN